MPITRGHRYLLLATSLLTLILVILGAVVCITGSSRGCPDWPACYGQLVPPMRVDSILEYTHRVAAALTSLFIVASAVTGWRRTRSLRWVSWPPLIAIGFLLAVIALGAMVVLRGLSPGLAALDLGSALMVLALVVTATTVAFARHGNPDLPDRFSLGNPQAGLALATLILVFVVLVSGVLVAANGSPLRCLGWPLYGGGWPVAEGRQGLQLARRLLGGMAGVPVIALALLAWRQRSRSRPTRSLATVMGILFLAEALVGGFMILYEPGLLLQIIHAALAAVFWATLVALGVLVGLARSMDE